MTLHTWNKYNHHVATFDICLAQLGADDALLLLEDAVCLLLDADFLQRFDECATRGSKLFVLAEDLAARGISARISPVASVIGYKEFVSLCLHHERVANWF